MKQVSGWLVIGICVAMIVIPVIAADICANVPEIGRMNQTPNQTPGEQGIQGVNGTPGEQGVNGTPGSQGVNGTPGAQGIQGDPGTPGTPGSPGANASVDVNATFTGEPGTPASVINIGTSLNALLDFIVPRGETNLTADHGLLTNKSEDGHPQYILVAGTRPFTGKQSMGGFNLTDLLNPVALQDAATKDYVDASNNSMKAYVDGKPTINETYATKVYVDNNVTATNNSMKAYVDAKPIINETYATKVYVDNNVTATNNSMRNYVDAKADSSWNISYALKDGTRPFTGAISMSKLCVTYVDTGTVGSNAANKSYVDSLVDMTWNTTYPLLSGVRSFTGAISMAKYCITYVDTGTVGSNAANKTYVDSKTDMSWNASYPLLDGTRSFTGAISMAKRCVTYVDTGSDGANAANKSYVDTAIAGVGGGDTSKYYFLNGTRMLEGKMNAAQYNLSNITTITEMDAANKSYVDAVNTSRIIPITFWFGHASHAPADNTFSYFGNKIMTTTVITAAGRGKIYVRKACTIKGVEFNSYAATTAGSNEAWSLVVITNGAMNNNSLVQTVSAATAERVFTNFSMNTAMAAGDYFEMRLNNPLWATNPQGVTGGGYLYCEMTYV